MPTQNPNWPFIQVLWSPTTNAVYDSNIPAYTDITLRCLQQWVVQRGRQYELDQMQAGTLETTLNNRDGAFNPVSATSPFAPGVLPERSIMIQAQWPPTANLLTGDQATGGETSGDIGPVASSMRVVTAMGGVPSTVGSATAWQGTQVFQQAVAANANLFDLIGVSYVPIRATTLLGPATTYTFSAYCRSVTSGANPSVEGQIRWFTATGTQISVTAGSVTALAAGGSTAAWTRVSVTGTPPATAVYALVCVNLEGTAPSIAWTYQQDGMQFEMAASPSTFAAPVWYPIFAGNVDRYPNVYDLGGTRALTTLEAYDAFGMLSQSVITGSLDGLIANPAGDNSLSGASFNYWFGDSGGNEYVDALGNRNYGQGLPGKYGIGTITAGVAVTSSVFGENFSGSVQTCVSFTAPGGPGGSPGAAMSAIALPPGPNGQYGPGSGTGLGYTRMIAFKCTQAPTSNGAVLWFTGAVGNYVQGVMLAPGGSVQASVIDANHPTGLTPIGSYDVGGWHLAWLGVAADGSSFLAGVDGTVSSFSAGANNFAYPSQFIDELVGAQGVSASNPNSIAYNFQGDLALYVEWPELLTPAAIASIYQAWRSGYTGDSTGERAANILDWAHYIGPTAIDTGSTTSLAAATDVNQTDALTALQDVVATEGGEHFMSAGGNYTFYARSRRLGSYSPVYSFGSNTAGGEIPFEDVQFDFDPTLIENNVTNTQTSTNQTFYSVNETSVQTFGARQLAQSNQSSNVEDVQDQADWYAGVYGYPRLRVASMTLHPSANPSLLWPVCLSLELGQYVQVTQRPMGAAVGALDPVMMYGFIENITITGQNTADATWVVEISAAVASGAGPSQPALEPWNLALLHTTLHTSVSAGASTITIDALPTAGTSTLAQNLPQGGVGMNFVVGSNLVTQETLTIASVSATTLGYTTATITFTTPLANNHTAGEIVREPLGGGSLRTWQSLDAFSTLGTAMITY